ncbi:hypothetical protein E3Q03_01801 [Wallemia mellicola]|uniref:Uncharacterized protein n=1 Tax=Wallemia mellicola TaxID=1708541 RepID=A0AB74KFM0_9BASI|nr:hypothetical protein E3Q03_01801 [Wallemia mellicola]
MRNALKLLEQFKPKVKILSFGYAVNLGSLGDRGMYTFQHSYFTLKILPPSKTESLVRTKLDSLPFPHNDFGLRYWLYLDAIGRQDGYGFKRVNVAELPLVVITPIAYTSKKAVIRNRLRKRIRKCVTSVIEQSMVTTRGGADDLILRDWTYVFYPSIILEKGDVHSNDIDKAMIDILKQARKVGLDKTLSLYNKNEDSNHEN